jgi:glycosyltransferase involved in cell wall biosynthesis
MSARTLCLNMIVRDETANLERCLGSIVDHIDCWVIADTGSTDGTQGFIQAFFAQRGLPGELHSIPFVNFEQARNLALGLAGGSALAFDHLLLADADGELVVEDSGFRALLEAPAYELADGGAWNTRIVRRDSGARYRGVTHAHLEVLGGSQRLGGVGYRAHDDGSRRGEKLQRDIKLLVAGIRQEPGNHRYWFQLAQSLKDSGHPVDAAKVFARRATMGGWDDEAWYARLQEARCLLALGDEAGFSRAAMTAFNLRPRRGEPLYELARFYRERGMFDASVLFAEAGLALDRPDGASAFVEDFVYTTGLLEEYSIAAFYSGDPARKQKGHAACDLVSLSREAPESTRGLARSNLSYYTGPASELLPSFSARPVAFTAPNGWRAINPSVVRQGAQIVMVQRCVNYTVTEAGEYKTEDGPAIATRNFLLRLNTDLEVVSAVEILPPADLPTPFFELVLGFENARPFVWRGALWCCATVRQLTPEGWCETVLARIDGPPDGPAGLVDWRVLRPDGPRQHEMDWIPLVVDGAARFIRSCDPVRVLDEQAGAVSEAVPSIAAETFRGGSQAIAFDRGWLALVFEIEIREGKRHHWHRFVWFDAAVVPRRASRRFWFQRAGVENALGLAWHPDGERLLISFGVAESEAWIATAEVDEVRAVLSGAAGFPAGGQGEAEVGDGRGLPRREKARVCGGWRRRHECRWQGDALAGGPGFRVRGGRRGCAGLAS